MPGDEGKHPGGTGAYRIALLAVMAIALAIRLWNVLAHTYVVFFDETFQYLEQAHRLAFGSGVVPWEYIEGIRSWLLPGALALMMRLAATIHDGPETYIVTIRLACIALSLTVPYVGFRVAARRFGLPAAIATGLLCALWYELVYYAPVVLAEVLATHIALLAIWLGDGPASGVRPARRLALAGVLFGLAVVLRYQYAPALAVAAIWQHGRDRTRWLPLCAGALATLAIGTGLLDLLTWGSPFQSVWLNFKLNAVEGVAAALVAEPWYFLPSYFLAAWGSLAVVLAGLALIGAIEMPALAIVAVAVVALHSFTPHKEVRFIYLALAAAPILMGLGIGRVLTRFKARPRAACAVACAVPVMLAAGEASWADLHATSPDAWHYARSVVQVFEAAHAEPGLCGLGVRSMRVYGSGGYTYLDRGVPIYFEAAAEQSRFVTATFRLHLDVIARGRSVPQYSPEQFRANGGSFNVLIAATEDGLPGYERGSCFGAGGLDDPRYCLFRRPGGCVP